VYGHGSNFVRDLQRGFIHEWEGSIDAHCFLACGREGVGKLGRDDGTYGSFQRNDMRI